VKSSLVRPRFFITFLILQLFFLWLLDMLDGSMDLLCMEVGTLGIQRMEQLVITAKVIVLKLFTIQSYIYNIDHNGIRHSDENIV
jgi:hypothetical protein